MIRPSQRMLRFILIFTTLFAVTAHRAHSQDYCDGSPDPYCWCEEYGDCGGDDCPENARTCDGGGGGLSCDSSYESYLVTTYDMASDEYGNFEAWATLSDSSGQAGPGDITVTLSATLPDGSTTATAYGYSTNDSASATASVSAQIAFDSGNTNSGYLSIGGNIVYDCGVVFLPIRIPQFRGFYTKSQVQSQEWVTGANGTSAVCFTTQWCTPATQNPPCNPSWILQVPLVLGSVANCKPYYEAFWFAERPNSSSPWVCLGAGVNGTTDASLGACSQ